MYIRTNECSSCSFLTQTCLSHDLVYRSSSQEKSKRWRCRSRRSRGSRSRSRLLGEEEGLVNEVDAERHRSMPAEEEAGRNRHRRTEEPSFKAGSVKEQN
jgi:hypothetical protein